MFRSRVAVAQPLLLLCFFGLTSSPADEGQVALPVVSTVTWTDKPAVDPNNKKNVKAKGDYTTVPGWELEQITLSARSTNADNKSEELHVAKAFAVGGKWDANLELPENTEYHVWVLLWARDAESKSKRLLYTNTTEKVTTGASGVPKKIAAGNINYNAGFPKSFPSPREIHGQGAYSVTDMDYGYDEEPAILMHAVPLEGQDNWRVRYAFFNVGQLPNGTWHGIVPSNVDANLDPLPAGKAYNVYGLARYKSKTGTLQYRATRLDKITP